VRERELPENHSSRPLHLPYTQNLVPQQQTIYNHEQIDPNRKPVQKEPDTNITDEEVTDKSP